ncbi:rhomboid family intramembrane serine protease [Aliiroseovarius sp. 2305UL8-7]|uniref:rhomboid family intramembrane serine protease n=1 Tax=Aliiroseovarius conchicola TaxID=3121637 RepID=UPI00352883D5
MMIARAHISDKASRVLLCLIAINVAIELVLTASDVGILDRGGLRQSVYQNGAFWAGLLHNWRPNYAAQPWTMFATYAFLHGGLAHLAGNMLTLWILGRMVIARAGLKGFWIIYILSAIGGGLGFGLLSLSARPMVGASGALFGLIGAVLYWRWSFHKRMRHARWPVLRTVGVLVGLNLLLWVLLGGFLAWETHLGGFVAGWLTAVAFDWHARRQLRRG